jgi:hypothetical protein
MTWESTVDYLQYVANQYRFYIGLFNLIVGLIGNIFIILVFTNLRLFRGNQCSFYLTIESFSNIGLLISIYSSRILTNVLGYDPTLVSLPWCKIRTMFAQIFGLWSLFTICCTTFDQYLATNHRYSFRQMSTMKLAHRLTIFNICFCILHSLLYLIFAEIQASLGCTVYHPILKKYLSFFYVPVLSSGLPLIITVSFSLLSYRNVRRIIRRQIPLVRRRLDRQLTAMVLGRVICLIILGLPFIFISIYEFNINENEDNYMKLAIVYLLSVIFYSSLYTNFSVNSNIILILEYCSFLL